MTKEQVEWAKQHDWFKECYYNERLGCWVVLGETSFIRKDGTRGVESIRTVFYDDLRRWAGY